MGERSEGDHHNFRGGGGRSPGGVGPACRMIEGAASLPSCRPLRPMPALYSPHKGALTPVTSRAYVQVASNTS